MSKKTIMFPCDLCQKIFLHRNNMYRHRRTHGAPKIKKEYICDRCGFKCCAKKELIDHLRKDHYHYSNAECKKSVPGIRLKCPECDVHVIKYEYLDSHLYKIHDISIQEEYLEFLNEEEFRAWKTQMEKDTQSQYCSIRGLRKLKNYTKREYVCHRSYNAKLKSNGRKRDFKTLVTNKIGAACPSRIIVKITDEKVEVRFVRLHVGHSTEVIRLRLTSDERSVIAEKLRDGITLQQVLDDVRDTSANETVQRVHYLQKKDLYNIIRDYDIRCTTSSHKNDDEGVQLLVATLCKLDNSPVLHYDANSDNFSLIVMTHFQKLMLLDHPNKIYVDGAHGPNADGYELVSIVVIDEYDNGIPVAFCFTKKTDLAAMSLFFSKVKEALGCSIKSDTFMCANDVPHFHDAWATIMGKPTRTLLCWWHVSKNWTKGLQTKITDAEKRKYVKHTLCLLANSTSDRDIFESNLTNFLNELNADEDTRQFYDYFSSCYVPKKTSRAFCYRQHIRPNTNMHLETLHKKMKHLYLEGKRCPQFDKALDSLLKLVRDAMYERIIKLAKNQPTDRARKVKAAHTKRTEIYDEDIECVKESEQWHVKSRKNKRLVYELHRVSDNCLDTNLCVIRCTPCDVCIHTYKCSCIDNVVYLNVCKHIHKIAEKNQIHGAENLTNCKQEIQVQDAIELLECHPTIKIDNRKQKTEELKSKLQLLMQWCDNFSEVEADYVSKKIDEAIQIIQFNRENKKFAKKLVQSTNYTTLTAL